LPSVTKSEDLASQYGASLQYATLGSSMSKPARADDIVECVAP
jgi:hypothetical protein